MSTPYADHFSLQVFEAEKMNTKRGLYHKKCFACCKCKSQLDYFNCIEGPDDDIYCKVCYLRYWGPGKFWSGYRILGGVLKREITNL